jgi:quinol monooxygenase YgiN
MITHIVLGKGEGLGETERRELAGVLDRLRGIPGVEDFSWGNDVSGRGKGYTIAMVAHFTDREALQRYLGHPSHLEIVEALNRLMPERLVVDYETGMSAISA